MGEGMGKISFKGVLVGGITDIVATNVLAVPLIVYVIAAFGLSHLPPGRMSMEIMAAIHDHWPLRLMQAATGVGCSVFGGYVAARLAKHDELLNAALSSFLCVAIGIYSIALGRDAGALPTAVATLFSSVVFALLGGYLRLLQSRKAS